MADIDIDQGKQFAESVSKTLTEKVVDVLSDTGFAVSPRLASLILFLISLLLLYIAVKISQPVLKTLIIILSILIIIGLFIPW